MITITSNNTHKLEKEYIFDIIFKRWLGLEYGIVFGEDNCETYTLEVNENKLIIPDMLFKNMGSDYSKVTLPDLPLKQFTIEPESAITTCTNEVPIIFGKGDFSQGENEIILPIDVFGSAFFMLTCLDEFNNLKRDNHDRFSAYDSLAYKANFLDRPIINEYIEILFYYLNILSNNSLLRKSRNYEVTYTCDVDELVRFADEKWVKCIRFSLGELKRTKSITKFLLFINKILKIKLSKRLELDPAYQFAAICSILDRYKQKGEFYLLNRGKSIYDVGYSIPNKYLSNLMTKLVSDGHKVGIHGSYLSYKDKNLYISEFNRISTYLTDFQHVLSAGRQHYLNWDVRDTPDILDSAGLQTDLTLSYADRVGFRCGTCYEFPLFDLKNKRVTKVIEKPLIVMECSLIDERYMNLGYSRVAYDKVVELREKCRQFNGNFVILWHNTRFENLGDIALLEECFK